MQRISILAGGAVLAGAMLGRAPTAGAQTDASIVWSGRMSDGSILTVRNISGAINVVEAAGDRVEVRATKRARAGRDPSELTFDVRDGASATTICAVYRGENACEDGRFRNMRIDADLTISMPRGLRLRASTGNGRLSVDKAGSDVDVSTGNGEITIGQTEGRVSASSGNGNVEIESAKGPVHVSSGNGRIFVSTSEGPVSASTGNGDIDVRMRALSTAADMEFSSGSGTIRVTLPSEFNGELEASTGNGELRSDFEIQIRGRLDPQHMRGTIGRGGRLIRLTTGNGRIEIRKGS